MISTLCGEPFCWPLSEAREVTDEWFDRIIVEHSRRRAKQLNRGDGDGEPIGDDEDELPKVTRGKMPTKTEYIMYGQALGGNPDELGKAYDKWKKSKTKKG